MIKINEIYKSIQGESTYTGRPCVFIRTTGCPLRCTWCDTTHAFHEGTDLSVDDVLRRVAMYGCSLVEITGGEPLIQSEVYPLTIALLDAGYEVLIETSGSLPVDRIDPRAVLIMDIKCPSSGMSHAMHWDNLRNLRRNDEVKFVIADQEDYLYAKEICTKWDLLGRHPILFSPAFDRLSPRHLAEWILKDALSVRLQIQLHKYVWDPAMRGV